MRGILIYTICFLLLLPFGTTLAADNDLIEESNIEETKEASRYFNMELETGTQSVWNNTIPITIRLQPTIDAVRVEIDADTPTGLDFEYLGEQYFPVEAGETYELQSRIIPQREGEHRITINAISWEHGGTNYSSSSRLDIEIDEDLQIVPQSSAYTWNLVLKYTIIVLLIAGLGFVGFHYAKKGYKRFKKWLLPE